MTLLEFGAAFLAVTPNVSHYEAHKKPDQYILWAEDEQPVGVYGNDAMIMQFMGGTLDYFTTVEFDPKVKEIQAVLNGLPVAWRLNSVQNPAADENGYIHHEWVWSMEIEMHGHDDV